MDEALIADHPQQEKKGTIVVTKLNYGYYCTVPYPAL